MRITNLKFCEYGCSKKSLNPFFHVFIYLFFWCWKWLTICSSLFSVSLDFDKVLFSFLGTFNLLFRHFTMEIYLNLIINFYMMRFFFYRSLHFPLDFAHFQIKPIIKIWIILIDQLSSCYSKLKLPKIQQNYFLQKLPCMITKRISYKMIHIYIISKEYHIKWCAKLNYSFKSQMILIQWRM